MLYFLWWFVAGPIVGWLLGRLMRAAHNPWLDALVGLIGAIVAGTLCTFTGVATSVSPLEAILIGAGGALVVTFAFQKIIGEKVSPTSKPSSGRSYTSYKSRMGK
jgi:uncharacterized membrane protein YeaQ/YmgE (transglycosylase-associated protein family)